MASLSGLRDCAENKFLDEQVPEFRSSLGFSWSNDPISRCAIPPAAARTATARLGSFAGYVARAWRRVPPRCAVSRVNGTQRHSHCGVNRARCARFNITRHSVKSPRSLRCAAFLGAIAPLRCAPWRVDRTGVMSRAPARLPGRHVRLAGAWFGRSHGARACGACGRAAPAVRARYKPVRLTGRAAAPAPLLAAALRRQSGRTQPRPRACMRCKAKTRLAPHTRGCFGPGRQGQALAGAARP